MLHADLTSVNAICDSKEPVLENTSILSLNLYASNRLNDFTFAILDDTSSVTQRIENTSSNLFNSKSCTVISKSDLSAILKNAVSATSPQRRKNDISFVTTLLRSLYIG